MLFAEISAEGWSIIVAAVFVGAAKIVSMVLDYRREQAKINRDLAAAEKVAEVKKSLDDATEAVAQHAVVQDETMKSFGEKLEVVHIATNSMKDALVAVTEKEALLRGNAQGRQDERDERDDKNHDKDAQKPIQPSLANLPRKDGV